MCLVTVRTGESTGAGQVEGGCAPVGRVPVSGDEIGDGAGLTASTEVDGVTEQEADTDDGVCTEALENIAEGTPG